MKREKIGKRFENNFWDFNAKYKLEVLPVAIS
jgi:hypothetical protein